MYWETKFEVNVEIPFGVVDIDEFKEWVKALATIKEEYGCNCTLSISGPLRWE